MPAIDPLARLPFNWGIERFALPVNQETLPVALMPAALDVEHEPIKAHALVHGVRDAARAFGLPEDTVRQWSAREGWLKNAGVAIVPQPLPASMQPRVTNVTKAGDAALSSLQKKGAKSKLHLANFVLNGAKEAARMKGPAIFAIAPAVKSIADIGKTVHPEWAGSAATPTLRLELIAGALGDNDPLPVIDVQAEVSRGA